MSEVISIHAARSATTADRSTTTASRSTDGNSFSAALADARKRPTGEKIENVTGHQYDKIVAGSDKGEYLNRSGNARDGEAFRIVQRGGRTFHVYGSDKDHKVFELRAGSKPAGSESPTGGTPAA